VARFIDDLAIFGQVVFGKHQPVFTLAEM